MVYYRLNNEEVCDKFLKGADPKFPRYKIFSHASLPNHFIAPLAINYTVVSTVKSEYMRSVGPMNQLLMSAFNHSTSEFDRFIFFSENSIPVKPFTLVLNYFASSTSGQPRPSDFCITPSN
jgi:hypothetical protein